MPADLTPTQEPRAASWARLLLVLPFIAMLWVPSYNSVEPTLAGIPFFYWYQLAWVPLTSLLTWIVYRSVRRAG
jgi:hypothetical protein